MRCRDSSRFNEASAGRRLEPTFPPHVTARNMRPVTQPAFAREQVLRLLTRRAACDALTVMGSALLVTKR